jgi:EAL domain-containing protein (putative c-di-GMP-specific phosphodiesterase class I)
MSTQEPPFLALTNARTRASPETVEPPHVQLRALRLQVLEIIDEVLSDSSQATDAVREELRRHIAAHPGHPEEALLEHLTSLRQQQSDETVADPAALAPATVAQPSQQAGSPRLEAVLRDRMLMTAFQPIFDLTTAEVVGAEALTRFVSDGGDPADYWFAEAEDTGLRTDLEFAALESALKAAMDLPPQLFVALKLSHSVCLDPRLASLFDQTPVAPARVVLEISGQFPPDQAASLDAAVAPLRGAGVRLSIENSGSYSAAVRHILRLKPEMIKLDPSLTKGLDRDPLRQELVRAELGFARETGAVLTAQRIETKAELAAVAGLGITVGQGYHLGRPSVQPRDWATWAGRAGNPTFPGRSRRATKA